MSVKVDIPISKTEISNRLKEQIYSKWQLHWTTSPEYKHSKLFLSKPDTNRAKRILQLPRLKLIIFVEIITGHNNLSYFQFKVDPDFNPLCRFCEEENETFLHFITNCPHLKQNSSLSFKIVFGNLLGIRLNSFKFLNPHVVVQI